MREPATCPHSRIYSDYHLQKRSDKSQVYQSRKLWWSDEIKRWMCTDADTIRSILLDSTFKVSSYSQEKIAQRLGISLDHITNMVGFFPLALDGNAHKHIRKRHAAAIALTTEASLHAFSRAFADHLQDCLGAHHSIDITESLLKPAVRAFITELAGINTPHLEHGDSLSQVLDETLSIATRSRIDQVIEQVVDELPEGMPDAEKYFRISMVALGTDSLLGTLTESVHLMLDQYGGIRLSSMQWPGEPPATGVPVIERMATEDRNFFGLAIVPGQRVRLYIDAAGYGDNETPAFQPLYFGAGRHVCLGMSLAKQIWKIVVEQLSRIDRTFEIVSVAYRDNDNVFNLYKTLEVRIHE